LFCVCPFFLQAFQGLISRLQQALAAIAQQAADAQAAADAAAAAADEQQDGQEEEEQQEARQQQDAAAAAVAAAEAARRLCLVQMQGFSRMYSSQVVMLGLAQQLLQAVDDALGGQEGGVRAAILGPLYLE
jgi:hypothetical protein